MNEKRNVMTTYWLSQDKTLLRAHDAYIVGEIYTL